MENKDDKRYCVYQHKTPDGKVYIGCTCNVERRWKPSNYKQNNTPFKDAIERFGWDNITHEVLFENLTRDQALKREDELICKARENGTCLNVNRSGHYKQTDEFREESKAYRKAYYEAHPEEEKARSMAWYEANKEERKVYYESRKEELKAYYESHKEEYKARTKSWREAHRDEWNAYMRERYRLKKLEKEQSTKQPTKPKNKKPLF